MIALIAIILFFITMPSVTISMEQTPSYFSKKSIESKSSLSDMTSTENESDTSSVTFSASEQSETTPTLTKKRSLLKRKTSGLLKKKHPLDIKSFDVDKRHNKTDKTHNTPLIYAAQQGNVESVKTLLAYPTLIVNHSNQWGNTALHCAIMAEHFHVAHLLLQDNRIDPSLINKEGLKAYQCFNLENSEQFVMRKELYIETSKHDKENNTALMYAAENDDLDALVILCEDEDINHRNIFKQTALHLAAMKNHVRIIQYLLTKKNLNASHEDNNNLHAHHYFDKNNTNAGNISLKNELCKRACLQLKKNIDQKYFNIKQLIKQTYGVNTRDADGTNLLIWAICSNQKTSLIKKILAVEELDINYQDTFFGSAFHYAILLERYEALLLLLGNHRINPTNKSILNLLPHQHIIQQECLNKKQCTNKTKITKLCDHCSRFYTFRMVLFPAYWLHDITKSQTFDIILKKGVKNCTQEFQLTDSTIQEIIENTKTHYKEEAIKQAKTANLPVNSTLPEYATDIFLTKMIQFNYVKHWIKDITK